jgi:hypothetical protein
MCFIFLMYRILKKIPNIIYFMNCGQDFEFAWISDDFLKFELILKKKERKGLSFRFSAWAKSAHAQLTRGSVAHGIGPRQR